MKIMGKGTKLIFVYVSIIIFGTRLMYRNKLFVVRLTDIARYGPAVNIT